MIHLERVAMPDVPWTELDAAADRTHCQTRAWLDFLAETQLAEPVVARVWDGPKTIGWFTGAIVRGAGLRFLGSPLRGWTTSAMGFNLEPDVDRPAVLAALPSFAFDDLRCVHVEVADRGLSDIDAPPGFHVTDLPGWELRLDRPDDDLLAAMRPRGRRDVRRAGRNGITVEEVDPFDPGDFVDEYYRQVTSAFAKRARTPTFPAARVESLIRHLGPTGHLLLLRARTADGQPAATGLSIGLPGSLAEASMGAGDPAHQHLLPNEALMWAAMRTWRERGAVRFGFGGGGSYKAKYGGVAHVVPWLRTSRPAVLELGRSAAFRLHRRRQALRRRPVAVGPL